MSRMKNKTMRERETETKLWVAKTPKSNISRNRIPMND
uniref:Uncharacterized protein n=1 Tax=Rhizophora mucronata TaxID=61149 RepID=A0A2P2JBT4_RHIMU